MGVVTLPLLVQRSTLESHSLVVVLLRAQDKEGMLPAAKHDGVAYSTNSCDT